MSSPVCSFAEHGGLCTHPVLGAGETPKAPALSEPMNMGGKCRQRESRTPFRCVDVCADVGSLDVLGETDRTVEGPSPDGGGWGARRGPQKRRGVSSEQPRVREGSSRGRNGLSTWEDGEL